MIPFARRAAALLWAAATACPNVGLAQPGTPEVPAACAEEFAIAAGAAASRVRGAAREAMGRSLEPHSQHAPERLALLLEVLDEVFSAAPLDPVAYGAYRAQRCMLAPGEGHDFAGDRAALLTCADSAADERVPCGMSAFGAGAR